MPLLAVLVLAAGCASTPDPIDCPTRTELEWQDRAVWRPLPEEYIDPLPVPDLPERRLTNRDLEQLTDELISTVAQCNADRKQVRDLQPDPAN